MSTLAEPEIKEALTQHAGWGLEGNTLRKVFKFATFLEGIAFVQTISIKAEEADHHPDIDVRYTEITVTLSTHSEGGVTQKDLDLVAQIEHELEATI